jgi:hypothetical protein
MLLLILLIITNIYILCQTGKKKVFIQNAQPEIKKWTVYGTMTCKWTRKQLEYFERTQRHYVFINCNEESCDKIDGFPYIIHPDGEVSIGYTEF